jgi:peptide/nickel transport system permease protein
VPRYLLTRVLHGAFVLLVVLTLTFAMLQFSPGGPTVLLDPDLTREDVELLRARYGLDQPIHVQYLAWISAAARLDLGDSFTLARPVASLIADRLPATLLLSSSALLLSIAVALPLGILAARNRGRWIDHLATFVAVAGVSIPSFWFGIVLILLFSVTLRLLPSSGMLTPGQPFQIVDLLRHLVMPLFVLCLITLAQLTRYMRSSMLGVLRQDYVRTARAKGLSEPVVLVRHAVRNALVPVVTVIGLLLPRLFGGAVVVETVFGWPGIARLAVNAAFQRDYPVVMGVTLMIAMVVVISNLVVDVLYAYIDPRIRLA